MGLFSKTSTEVVDPVVRAAELGRGARSLFTDAVADLEEANALLGASIEDDEALIDSLTERVNSSRDAVAANSRVAAKISDIFEPAS